MNRKQLILIVVGLALAGAASLVLSRKEANSWETAAPAGKLLEFDLNNVSQVTLQQPSAELNLVKKGELWTVKERADFPANFEKVGELIRKFWELKPVQSVKVGASQFGRLNLVEPGKGADAGALLTFKDKDGKALASILVGKEYTRKSAGEDMPGFPAGRYVLAPGKQPSLIGDALSDLVVAPEGWLETAFINVSNIRSIAVSGTAAPWKLVREKADADWKLEAARAGEQLDPVQVSSFNTLLSNAKFADLGEAPADAKPMTALIETFDGFTYNLSIGQAKEDKYPVKVAISGTFAQQRIPGKDEKPEDKAKLDEEFQKQLKGLQDKLAREQKFQDRSYLLNKFVISGLLKERKELLKAPEPAPSPTPAAKKKK